MRDDSVFTIFAIFTIAQWSVPTIWYPPKSEMWYLYTKVTQDIQYNLINIRATQKWKAVRPFLPILYLFTFENHRGMVSIYLFYICLENIFLPLFFILFFFFGKKTFLSHIFCCFCMVFFCVFCLFYQQKQPKNGNFWVELGKIVCLVSGNGSLVTHTNWTGSNRGFYGISCGWDENVYWNEHVKIESYYLETECAISDYNHGVFNKKLVL